VLQAGRKGRASKLGMIRELGAVLASNDAEERRRGIKALWFFVYLMLLFAGWLVYAA
jgi:hypothetical protein